MGILDFFFSQPKVVSEAKAEAKILFKEYEKVKGKVGMNCVHLLKKPILEIFNNRKKHKAFENHLIKEGITPKIWLLRSIALISSNAVSSGKNHMHRGVLNPMDGSDALLPVCFDAFNRLVELGDVKKKWVEENNKALIKNVKSVG